jgi:hypothetical protein
MLNAKRNWVLGLAALAMVGMQAAPAMAESARVHLQIYKAGFIVGVSGGQGAMTFQGRRFPLAIGGVSLGATIGASRAELIGTATNVRRPSDIEGTYSATEAGLAVAGGGKVAVLRNSKGVVLRVRGKQIGLMFSVDLSGMQVSIRR